MNDPCYLEPSVERLFDETKALRSRVQDLEDELYRVRNELKEQADSLSRRIRAVASGV
jgi:hypothetical protein